MSQCIRISSKPRIRRFPLALSLPLINIQLCSPRNYSLLHYLNLSSGEIISVLSEVSVRNKYFVQHFNNKCFSKESYYDYEQYAINTFNFFFHILHKQLQLMKQNQLSCYNIDWNQKLSSGNLTEIDEKSHRLSNTCQTIKALYPNSEICVL